MTVPDAILIIASGLAAGFLNAVSGGGAMLTVPALIFIGIPPGIANGTNRIAVSIQNLVAIAAYQRLGATNHRLALSLALPATLGALCGAVMSVRLDDEVFRTILGVVMLLLLGPVLAEPWLRAKAVDQVRTLISGWGFKAIFFLVGVYGGFIQIGVGIVTLVALHALGGIDLVLANGMKFVVVFCVTTLALGIFIIDGKVAWGAGLLLAVANSIGVWFGAHWGVHKGDLWIRTVVTGTVLAMALQLLGVLAWVGTLLG